MPEEEGSATSPRQAAAETIQQAQGLLIDAMRAAFEIHDAPGTAEANRLSELMGIDLGADTFWQLALESLAAGQIQIGFAPVSRSAEIHRVADFLNEQLALLAGQSVSSTFQEALDPLDGVARPWNERSFFEALAANRGEGELAIADAVLAWARDRGLIILWDGTAAEGSFTPALNPREERYETATITTNGVVRIDLAKLRETALFGSTQVDLELQKLLIGLPRGSSSDSVVLSLTELAEPQNFGQVLGALDWIVDTGLLGGSNVGSTLATQHP